MNLSAKGRKLLGAFGLGRSDRGARRVTDPDGGSAQYAASSGTGFSKTDEIMNTKTNMWCKSLAVLALSCALANTALGQAVQILWNTPAEITYGTPLDDFTNILNAKAVDVNGNDVTSSGKMRYFWNAPEVTASEAATQVAKRQAGYVAIGAPFNQGFGPGDSSDRDSNAGGVQRFDWLFLDAGNTTVRAVFQHDNQSFVNPSPVERTVKVNKAQLTAVPSTLTRNFGEENFSGYETGLLPRYPSGRFMFRLHRDGNGNLINDPNAQPNPTIIDASGKDGNGDAVAGITFDLSNGNRVLAKDDAANTVINDRAGNPLEIPVVAANANNHYSQSGGPITFSGFVRGENYGNLASNNTSVASNTEIIAGNALVTQVLLLSVKDGSGNDVFRGAPVGTTGTISFVQTPGFKNYSVATGANGTLTVSRARIEFKAKNFTDDDNGTELIDVVGNDGLNDVRPLVDGDGDGKHRRKTFGNGIQTRYDDDNNAGTPTIINEDLILQGGFGLANNFRLGEAFVEILLQATAPGLAVDSPVGNTSILLFIDTQTLTGGTDFLNNYEIVLTSGSVTTIAREFDLHALNQTKVYGQSNPGFSFQVENPAPHQVKANAAIQGQGNRGPLYNSGDLKDGFFSVTPVLSSSAGITAGVGNHTIAISDGAAANHVLKDKSNGTLSITRANLLLSVGNFGSVLGASLQTPTVTARGLLPFDTLGGILTNNPQFAFYDANGSVTEATVRNNLSPAGGYLIEISNKAAVRAANYNVFFNDGRGAWDGIGDPAGAAQDDGLAVDNANNALNGGGKQFVSFTGNAPVNAGPASLGYNAANPLFNTSAANNIGRYSTVQRGVIINWNQPSAVTFGDLLGGRLNATFVNPDTGLAVGDPANGGFALTEGTQGNGNYTVTYTADSGGAQIKTTGAGETYVLFKAGSAHKVKVTFNLHTPPVGIGFGSTSMTRDITVNARTIKVTPTNVAITFGNNVPNNGTYTFAYADLPGAHYKNGIGTNGAAIFANPAANNTDDFIGREVNDADRLFTTPATNTSDAGEYTLVASNFKAKEGNVGFNYVNAKFTINKAPTTLTWPGDLASITYGEAIGSAQLSASGPVNIEGSVNYNRTAGTILTAGVHAVEAQFIPTSSNYANSAKMSKNLTVNKKALTVGAQSTTRVFGDDNPTFSPTADSLTGLIPSDVGLITLTFQTPATNKSNVGKYNIEPVLSDSSNKLVNYLLTILTATVEVTKRPVTVTATDRSMQTETNPIPFLNDFQVQSPGADTRPNDRVVFGNLASFHAIKNEKFSSNNAEAFLRIRQLFPNINLTTTATINSANGTSFPITVATVGTDPNSIVNGAKADGNYSFTTVPGTLSVTDKKATITWASTSITYGQAIARSGVKRADKDKDSRTQAVNLFDATATPAGGTFAYSIKGQGELLDGIIFPASTKIELEVVYTPPTTAPDFGPTTLGMNLQVLKRDLNITILDQTNTYGSIDQNFQARYGEVQKTGESAGDYNNRQAKSPNRLVNGDTPESLDQQLVLFSNATASSGAGTYFIAVAQTAEDSNYNIRSVFGSQILRDGITRDPNNPNVILANVGNNIDGIGAPTSFVTSTGNQLTFNPGTATPSVPVNFPIGANATTTGLTEFHAGKLTVNKAPLTITADDLVKDQGSANPPFTATASADQLRNGDTLETLLKTQLIFVSGVNAGSPVGSFPISVTGASSDNYIITHRAGTFSVQPPQAAIGWSPNPSAVVYGNGLTADQLNATSTVAGTFDYSANPLGTVLGVGSQTLSVTFTPSDLALNRVTTVTSSLQVNPAPLMITANAINRGFLEPNPAFTVGFDGLVNGDTPSVLTAPVTFTTDGVDGANAGVYPLVPGGATAANYDISFVSSNVTISKATALITISDLDQVADGSAKVATVTTDPVGVGVNVTYNGNSAAPVDAGTYEVRVLANDPNYQGFALGTLRLSGSATVALDNLVQVFDGTGKAATVTTIPVGLGRTVTYNGSADAPVNAGTYEVRVVISDPVYSGFGVGVLTIEPATAEVTFDLDSLSQPVNGITGATVNTVPAGLNAEIFYGDTTSLPTEIGSTLIRGVINEPNWVGSVTSTFRVTNATQTVTTFSLPEFTMAGSPLNVGLVATASSGLPVTFSVSSGSASVNGNLLTVTQPGDIVVVASQAGDDFWAPAEASFTVSVTGQGVALEAPSLSVAGVSAAGIELAISGAAGATVSVMVTDSLPGGSFSAAGTVTLDGSGNGSITVPADGSAGYFKAANQ